jgi:serine/threonine-protein kinase
VPAKPRRRGLLIGAIAAAVLLVAAGVGVAVWQTQPNKPGTGSVSGHKIPAGFVPCGDALCPTQPLCWHGLTRIGDQGFKPGKAACTEPHYWETFAAGYLPADAGTGAELGELIDRPDIQALCSADRMAAHSRDASATTDWTRQAWPIEADAYTVLVHCLSGSPEGESLGAVFQLVK